MEVDVVWWINAGEVVARSRFAGASLWAGLRCWGVAGDGRGAARVRKD